MIPFSPPVQISALGAGSSTRREELTPWEGRSPSIQQGRWVCEME